MVNDANATAVRTRIILCVLAALCEGIDLQAAGVATSGIAPEFKANPDQAAAHDRGYL